MVAGNNEIFHKHTESRLETWVFEIKLPYPPSLNKLYPTNFKTKRRFLSQEGKDFKAEVMARLIKANAPFFEEVEHVEAFYTPPDKRKRDRGNLEKAWEDVFTEYGVWKDDSEDNSHFSQKLPPNKEDPHAFIRVIGKARVVTSIIKPTLKEAILKVQSVDWLD